MTTTTEQRRTRRRHPARGSRIGVTALSVASMFGLVGAMGLLQPASATGPTPGLDDPAVVVLTVAPQVQVVSVPAGAPISRTHGSR